MATPSTWPIWTGATAKSSTRTRGILQVDLLFHCISHVTQPVRCFSVMLAAGNDTFFSPHVFEFCDKIFDGFTVLVKPTCFDSINQGRKQHPLMLSLQAAPNKIICLSGFRLSDQAGVSVNTQKQICTSRIHR